MYFLLVVRAFLAFVICQALSNVTFAQAPDDIRVSLTLPWQFKGTFRGISVGYEFRIGKAKRRRYLWKRKNCQSSVSQAAKLSELRVQPQFGLFDKVFTAGVSFITDNQVKTLGSAAKGIVGIINYSATLDTPENRQFMAAWQ